MTVNQNWHHKRTLWFFVGYCNSTGNVTIQFTFFNIIYILIKINWIVSFVLVLIFILVGCCNWKACVVWRKTLTYGHLPSFSFGKRIYFIAGNYLDCELLLGLWWRLGWPAALNQNHYKSISIKRDTRLISQITSQYI